MKIKTPLLFVVAGLLVLIRPCVGALKVPEAAAEILAGKTFALAGPRLSVAHEFSLETQVITLAPDGARVATDVYKLRLKCTPAPAGGDKGDTFTCLGFSVQLVTDPEVAIPSLKGLSYVFAHSPVDGQGSQPMLGIPHAPFENLADAGGRSIPPASGFQIYDAFVDFHTFCDLFARPTTEGKGIQDLTRVGNKIVHATAFSEPAIDLGGSMAKGSFFKNGEVTLEFKGVGEVDGLSCAIVTADSGRSSFLMKMLPAPGMEIKTTGSCRYRGDIYLNLTTHWVSRVEANETVISETLVPPNKFNAVIERNITIHSVD